MGLSLKQKREWAKLLYIKTQMTQKEIAAKVEVTEKTLSSWVNKENWEMLRGSFIVTKEQELRRIYLQINELNTKIFQREEGSRFANSKEADTLTKLAAAARSLETDTSLANIIDTSIELLDWLRPQDFGLAQQFSDYLDAFIKHKLNRS